MLFENERVHFSDDGRAFTVEHVSDVEPIVDNNKRLQNDPQKRSDWGREVAQIPSIILTKWLYEEWNRGNVSVLPFSEEMDRLVARKLKDPEWKWLRTDNSSNPFFIGYR